MRLATFEYRKLTKRYKKVLDQWSRLGINQTTAENPKILSNKMAVEDYLYLPDIEILNQERKEPLGPIQFEEQLPPPEIRKRVILDMKSEKPESPESLRGIENEEIQEVENGT